MEILVFNKLDFKNRRNEYSAWKSNSLEVYIFTQDPEYILEPRLNPTIFQLYYY